MADAQSQWAELLLATLAEAGIRDAIISPGSRSTPLVWAACQVPSLRRHALIDERSAGFFALGQARVTGKPSLLICTSGTAPSHYYPAVIEARMSGVPLMLVMTGGASGRGGTGATPRCCGTTMGGAGSIDGRTPAY